MEEEATEAIQIEHHEMTSFAGVSPRFSLQPNHGSSFLSNFSVTSCVISHTSFARKLLYGFLAITCFPLVAGAAFTSIFLEDGNYHGAWVAALSACLSLGTVSLFVFHLLRKLENFHDPQTLEGLKILGMLMSVASGISLGVYTILAFIYKQVFELHGPNYFSAAIFSGLWLTSSLELYIVAQWYQNAMKAPGSQSRLNSIRPTTSAVMN